MTKKDFNKDQKIIEEWLGDIENLKMVRCKNVYGDRYRVDVFVNRDEGIFSTTKIEKSYFLKVNEGKVEDMTKST